MVHPNHSSVRWCAFAAALMESHASRREVFEQFSSVAVSTVPWMDRDEVSIESEQHKMPTTTTACSWELVNVLKITHLAFHPAGRRGKSSGWE